MMSDAEAVRAALDLYVMPSRLRQQQASPLPEGVLDVLRIAAGDDEVTLSAAAAFERSPELLQRASRFFVEEILLAPSSDSYRVFGLGSDAPHDALRRHMVLLAKWIHPDQVSNPLGHHYAERISLAWDDIKTPERRAEYDERLSGVSKVDPLINCAIAFEDGVAKGSFAKPIRTPHGRQRRMSVKSRLVALLRHITYGTPSQ